MNNEQTDGDEEVGAEPDHEAEAVRFSDGDLGTIQGILFGEQAERLERRILALEQLIESERAETRAAIESSERRLRDSVDRPMDRLTTEIATERDARIAAVDDLARECRTRMKLLDESIEGIHAQLGSAIRQRTEFAELLERAAGTLRAPNGPVADDS